MRRKKEEEENTRKYKITLSNHEKATQRRIQRKGDKDIRIKIKE